MFHYFSLEEVYKYAEEKGYSRDEVGIEEQAYEDGEVQYEVSFGHTYTEEWVWVFGNLDEVAIDYEHLVWED